VQVLDRNPEPTNIDPTSISYFSGDLLNREIIQEALGNVEQVFHLASTSTPKTSTEDPISDIHGNVLGTVNLLNEMRRSDVNQIVFVSSGGTVYGVPEQLPMAESHPTNPISSYGITKLAIEKYIQMYGYNYGIRYCILRVANAYGPRQNPKNPQGAISVMLRQALNNQEFTVWGDGSVTRDFVYVTDLVDAISRSSQACGNSIYNIGTQTGVSISELLQACEGLGINVPCRYEPPRSYDVPRVVLDISKAREALNWKPVVGLSEGLGLTYQYLLAKSQADEN
jgi:UDP-glucose 4-epimerase